MGSQLAEERFALLVNPSLCLRIYRETVLLPSAKIDDHLGGVYYVVVVVEEKKQQQTQFIGSRGVQTSEREKEEYNSAQVAFFKRKNANVKFYSFFSPYVISSFL